MCTDIPDDLTPLFGYEAWHEILNDLSSAAIRVERIANEARGQCVNKELVMSQIKSARRNLEDAMPHAVCPAWPQCRLGRCGNCKGRGWLTKSQAKLVKA